MVDDPAAGLQAPRTGEEAVLTFDGKRYDLASLSEETQELVRGVRVADSQLKFHEDTLKVIALGRQALALKLKSNLAISQELST